MREARAPYTSIFYLIYILVVLPIRILFPTRVLGAENLINDRGFVLAPNHISAIDPVFVVVARGLKKRMLIMGKEELFNINPLLNVLWTILGVFPIDRGAGNKKAVDQAMQEVHKGRGLLIFPEGTRSKDGNLGRLKSGAFVVAMQAGVDMIPCLVQYKTGKPRLFSRVTVAFGTPVTMEEMGLVGEYSAKKLRGAKQVYTQKLQELHERYKDQIAVV